MALARHPDEAISHGAYQAMVHQRDEARAEIERLIEAHKREVGQLVTRISDLELWIDSVGRTCPSNDTISDFLLGQD